MTRLGFTLEGVMRWQRVLPHGKKGLVPSGGLEVGPGRHTAMLAMCWDDWREKRENVLAMMER